MRNRSTAHRCFAKVAAIFAAVALAHGVLWASGSTRPDFVEAPFYTAYAAPVSGVAPALSADLVVLGGGLEAGLEIGMVCSVFRGRTVVGEIIIIDSRRDRSAALILDITEGLGLSKGDIARVKTT